MSSIAAMFRRLVDRFWAWANRRQDPGEPIACMECGDPVRHGDAVGGCCSVEHFQRWQDRTAW